MYCMFVGFEAAYDRVDHKLLFYKLQELGVPFRFSSILQELYKQKTADIWPPNGLTREFFTTLGLKQGCFKLQILYALFINDMLDCLEEGVWFGDLNVGVCYTWTY